MNAIEKFARRESTGQVRHDRILRAGNHDFVRLESAREILPNDLVVYQAGDSCSGEVSHVKPFCGYLDVVTGSGTISFQPDVRVNVFRPRVVTYARHRSTGYVYASGQLWNDASYALNNDFRAAEWRYVPMDDPCYVHAADLRAGEYAEYNGEES